MQVRIVWVGDAHPQTDETSVLQAGAHDDGVPDRKAGRDADGPIVHQHVIEVPAGATIAQALAALTTLAPADSAGLPVRIADGRLAIALFGQPATPATVLQENDRIELVGPLHADPKQARQHRVQQQRESRGDARWRRRGRYEP